MRRGRDPLGTHNERVKLLAGFCNTLGLGFLGFAFLRPLVEGTFAPGPFLVVWGMTGVALHGLAHYLLRYLEQEMRHDSL